MLVCDDGDTSGNREELDRRFPWVRWLAGPRRGPAANRNAGARHARGNWLLFLDDDCIPCSDWIAAYAAAFPVAEQPEIYLNGPTFQSSVPPSSLWEAPHNPDGKYLFSCNMAIPRAFFLGIGGFDERYPVAAHEDMELEERLRSLRVPYIFVPEAKVEHPLRRITSVLNLVRRWESKVIYALDHGATPFRVMWNLPWHVFRIIQSRFETPKMTAGDLLALLLFAGEWVGVLSQTFLWTYRWSRRPRSPFWTQHVSAHGPAQKFGF